MHIQFRVWTFLYFLNAVEIIFVLNLYLTLK